MNRSTAPRRRRVRSTEKEREEEEWPCIKGWAVVVRSACEPSDELSHVPLAWPGAA